MQIWMYNILAHQWKYMAMHAGMPHKSVREWNELLNIIMMFHVMATHSSSDEGHHITLAVMPADPHVEMQLHMQHMSHM